MLKAEIQESRKAVIIKGFPATGIQNGVENKMTLKNGFDIVLNRMGIKKEVKVDSNFRFKKKDTESGRKDSKVAPVRVQFCSALDKDLFMANIKKLNQSEFNKISVGPDIPTFFELDQIGYQFRMDNEGAKFSFGFRNQGLILLGKLKIGNKFKIIKDMS